MNDRADERRHDGGGDGDFAESWYLDFSRGDGTGGYVMLSLVPGGAWFWAALVSPEFGTVVVRDDDVPLPRGDALEIRADGLWAELVCETPMEHWGYGLEAFGLRYDDPADAYRGELGERLPVGLDLEWEVGAPRYDYFADESIPTSHYEHPGIIHGELLVGDHRVAFDGRGSRDHSWGARDWSASAWHWAAFQIGDDFATSFVIPGRAETSGGLEGPAFGAMWRDEQAEPVTRARVEAHLDVDGIPTAARTVLDETFEIDVEVLASAPVLVRRSGTAVSRFPRALCRFSCEQGTGTGWAEWNQPLNRSSAQR